MDELTESYQQKKNGVACKVTLAPITPFKHRYHVFVPTSLIDGVSVPAILRPEDCFVANNWKQGDIQERELFLSESRYTCVVQHANTAFSKAKRTKNHHFTELDSEGQRANIITPSPSPARADRRKAKVIDSISTKHYAKQTSSYCAYFRNLIIPERGHSESFCFVVFFIRVNRARLSFCCA